MSIATTGIGVKIAYFQEEMKLLWQWVRGIDIDALTDRQRKAVHRWITPDREWFPCIGSLEDLNKLKQVLAPSLGR